MASAPQTIVSIPESATSPVDAFLEVRAPAVADRLQRARRRASLRKIVGAAGRHGITTLGPLAISAAHFLASLVLLRFLSSTEFGEFSFVIVITALCLGLTNALICAPVASMPHDLDDDRLAELRICFKSSLVFAALLGAGTALTIAMTGASLFSAALFGIYSAAMSVRIFARSWAYWRRFVARVVASDLLYGASILSGLAAQIVLHRVSLDNVAIVMATSGLLAVMPFGLPLAIQLRDAILSVRLSAYGKVWRDMTRWSLAGVLTTEVSINAHSYLVTFISGPKSFALLAVGGLFMRPFSLVATAIPDRERPAMAHLIAAGDSRKAFAIARQFLVVMAIVWLATLALAAFVLVWTPDIIIRKGYDRTAVIAVVAWWAAMTAVRGIRASDSVFLQAARAFKPLADASTKSCLVALFASLALLLAIGPVASLGGILLGDIVMYAIILAGVRKWKAQHPDAQALPQAA